jgi:flagellar biosynthetic protein FliP
MMCDVEKRMFRGGRVFRSGIVFRNGRVLRNGRELWRLCLCAVAVVAAAVVCLAVPGALVYGADELPGIQTQETPVEANEPQGELPYTEPVTDEITDATLLEQLGLTGGTTTIDLIILLTILTLSPSILIMMTCFTRIIIAFSLLRNAMGVQQTPPNQVMIGLAMFLTLFVMTPVLSEMNEVAYQPYKEGVYTSAEAVEAASHPLKEWMLKNTDPDALDFFLDRSGEQILVETEDELLEQVNFTTVVPAFLLSEIKIGFTIGFLLFLPFLVIDIIVATILMSMGMIMLPPTMISVPFKILMFVLADGWTMLIGSLASGFNA